MSCIIHFIVTKRVLIGYIRDASHFDLQKKCVNALISVIFTIGYGRKLHPRGKI